MSQYDTIELVYSDKNNDINKVKGISTGQFIEFCLNEEPLDLKFNFRENTTDNKITIKSLLLENTDNQMFIEKYAFYLYFKGNKNFKLNPKEGTYNLIQKNKVLSRPSIISRNSMNIRLKKRLIP